MTKKNTTMQYGARALILFGAAGIAMAASQPVAAQETCNRFGATVQCTDPSDPTDVDLILVNQGYAGIADGFYDNLDTKIEQLAPTEAEEEAAQANVDAASLVADDANANNDAVQASLTDENLAAIEDVDAAESDLQDAIAAQNDASTTQSEAQVAFNEASDDLTDANADVSTAQADLNNAQSDVTAAEDNFRNDDSQANLDALNAALAARADTQRDLDEAETARADALALANAASVVLTDANEALEDAGDLVSDAGDVLIAAQDDLNTSLAANDDFVEAIGDAGQAANAAGLANVQTNADNANAILAQAEANQAGLDDTVNSLIRARDVLVPAAENGNTAIAAAAQAYLGDPRADETNAEVEVVAALVDHENRITTNETNIATNTTNIAANRTDIDLNTANITLNRTDIDTNTANITANAAAIVTESETRAAADAAILDQFAAEQNARIAADTALQNEITSIGSRISGLEGRLSELDDRISSSTATAIALGGMAFLPDMKFNLAVSAGFYEGSQAIAANIGYRVSPNVAITAGVGSGLNGESGTGGRVGFVFGF